MLRLATAEQMQRADSLAQERFGLPVAVLMESAGLATARVAARMMPRSGRVIILAGKGNNGGDGLVAARYLANWGARVLVVFSQKPSAGPAKQNLEIAQRMGLEIVEVSAKEIRGLEVLLGAADLVIDALLGTGISGPPQGLAGDLIAALAKRSGPILSVDLPSGTNSTGQVFQPHVTATATVTFVAPKLGHVLYPAAGVVGKVFLSDLGVPHSLIKQVCQGAELLDYNILKKLPGRDPQTHKGTAGKVLQVTGSPGLTGAATLAAEGALRAGAGLVTVATAEKVAPILACKLTEAMVSDLPAEEGLLGAVSVPKLLEQAEDKDAVVIGPGLSRGEGPTLLVAELLEKCKAPVVLDADGLYALSRLEERPKRSQPLILTPHSGELARLLGISSYQVEANRIAMAQKAAKRWQATVVLKGPATVIATAEGLPLINSTGNAAMASGGMGDLLSGIISGLLPQVKAAPTAAAMGVFVHGLAGDLAAEQLQATRGLVARDLLAFLPGILAGKYRGRALIRELDRIGKEGTL